MKRLALIGIGPGDPRYLTLQAVERIGTIDCFFLLEKEGRGKGELIDLRRTIIDDYGAPGHRIVTVPSPPRRMDADGYRAGVAEWHAEKRALFARLFTDELRDGEAGAFLLWGDPLLYDQTLALVTETAAGLPEPLAIEVIPGISAVQVLAAAARVPLNRVGETVTITTGRHVEHCDPAGIDNAFVMLDYNASFQRFTGQGMDLTWGAYVGSPDEVLIAGPLDEVLDEVLRVKAALREDKGWLMDTYLLRRRRAD